MKEQLKVFLLQKMHGQDEKWMHNEHINNKYRFYVTDNPDNIRTLVGGDIFTVRQSSKFDDGFLGDVNAMPIGDGLWFATMQVDRPEELRWHLKMHKAGWEIIPKKYYSQLVEVEGL